MKIADLQETTESITQQLKDTWKQLQSAKDEVSLNSSQHSI